MSRTKTKPREVKHYTYESISNQIFSCPIPPHWRKGQFVFNRASVLFGDDFVRSVGYDPYYKDERCGAWL